MSKSRRFMAPGSPLHGKEVPRDWGLLSPEAKRKALVSYGYAKGYEDACSKMGSHAAAIVRQRRELMEEERKRLRNTRHPEGNN